MRKKEVRNHPKDCGSEPVRWDTRSKGYEEGNKSESTDSTLYDFDRERGLKVMVAKPAILQRTLDCWIAVLVLGGCQKASYNFRMM